MIPQYVKSSKVFEKVGVLVSRLLSLPGVHLLDATCSCQSKRDYIKGHRQSARWDFPRFTLALTGARRFGKWSFVWSCKKVDTQLEKFILPYLSLGFPIKNSPKVSPVNLFM